MLKEIQIWKLNPSDVKNIILYGVLTFYIVKNCMKMKNIIKQRSRYASNFLIEYLPSLNLKLKMANLHMLISIVYALTYLSYSIFYRLFLQFYLSETIHLLLISYIDTLGLFFYIFLYRPRNFPLYFNVYLDNLPDSEEVRFNIYKIKLNSKDPLLFSNDQSSFIFPFSGQPLNKKEIKDFQSNNSNVIIINPIFIDEAGESFQIISNLGIGQKS
jgi:hypothetical protein